MDEEFRLPRLAAVYDVLDPGRSDLDHYVEMLAAASARRVLDVGCGTGCLALRLAADGCDVVGVDPAGASLDVARAKPGADGVRWLEGAAGSAGVRDVDAVVMTANVAMAIDDDVDWSATLAAAHDALRPGGLLLFETRRADARAWERWDREQTYAVASPAGGSSIESWVEVIGVDWPLIRTRWTFVFSEDAAVLTSTSVLRYRAVDELEAELVAHGFTLTEVRDAPDRPGREHVVLATRTP